MSPAVCTVCSIGRLPILYSPPVSPPSEIVGSAWSPSCLEQDPVGAAAHLHLLGESLSLIGLHLQGTNVSIHFVFVCCPVMSGYNRGSYFASSQSDLRLMLLGNIGCGKTSSADTILDQQSPVSLSRSCQLRQGISEGRNVTLVEAPRWYCLLLFAFVTSLHLLSLLTSHLTSFIHFIFSRAASSSAWAVWFREEQRLCFFTKNIKSFPIFSLLSRLQVAVVDTPDWFNTEKTPEEVRAQISSCVTLSSPGPHAFLLCVPLDQPAKSELQALGALESVFGPEAIQRYTLVLFTYADKLRESGKAGNDSVEAYITGQRGDLLKLVEKCGDKFHVMEIGGGWKEQRNVAELLEKVGQTVKEAGDKCYSCPAFQEAENRLRQRQLEIVKERKEKIFDRQAATRQLSSEKRVIYPYMQPVAEEEEEVTENEIENTRDEAEMSVRTLNIESLPPVMLSNMSPSLIQSIMEKMQSTAKNLPKLLADGSVWVGEGAKKVKSSPVWGTVGSGAQNVQNMVAASPVWGKMGAGAGHVSKMVGDRVPKVVVDGSSWVGSSAKAAAASPVWGKMGSGAKLMADGSMRVGAGFGSGAKNMAQSPLWGKVGSGAVSGAKLVAENSVRVGAGIGAGAKKVAQSPVWGKMGEKAKAGAKVVAESSVWEKIGTSAKTVPKVVIAGALLGLVLGVILAGMIGGAVGAATGSAVTEVGRRKFSNKNTLEKASDDAKKVETSLKNNMDSLVKQGEKILKTE